MTLDNPSSLCLPHWEFSYFCGGEAFSATLYNRFSTLSIHDSKRYQLSKCGDISPHPGPSLVSSNNDSHTVPSVSGSEAKTKRNCRYPCINCEKNVTARSKAINCDGCNKWIHIKCTREITNNIYDKLLNEEIQLNYQCDACSLAELPFPNLDDIGLENRDETATGENGACPAPFPGGVAWADSDVFRDFLKNKGLHILHANARSLLPKVADVKLILQRTSAAVLAITETWLDSTVSDNEIAIDGYSVLRRDRNRHGGGVCFYICDKLAFNLKPDLSTDVIKFLTIELLLPKTKSFLVTVTSRPPQDGKFLGAK